MTPLFRSIRTYLVLVAPFAVACTGSDAPEDPLDPTILEVALVTIDQSDVTLSALGETVTLTATATDGNGQVVAGVTVEWSVVGAGVVSVDASGTVAAIGNGTDRVRAAVDGVTATTEVTVRQVAVELSFETAVSFLTVIGGTDRIAVSATDANGHEIEDPGALDWSSSVPAVIHVDESGLLTAIAPGQTTITATSGGLSAARDVEVLISGPIGRAQVGEVVPCVGGIADRFDCSGVDLLAYIPIGGLGASGQIRVTDLWGWTDPVTGVEWALVERTDGTAFMDLSDPTRPRLAGFLPATAGSPARVWRDVKVFDDHAFIVADRSLAHGMQVFDLGQLRDAGPFPVTFSETTIYSGIASAHNIAINEQTGFAYAVGASSGLGCGGGLHMIDITNPSSPSFRGCFADPLTGRAGTGYVHDAQCVVYEGPDAEHRGREICIGSNETAIHISDVTDKSNPRTISVAAYPNVRYAHQGWLTDDFRYLYTNDELDELGGLAARTRTLVWDVIDLDDPVLVREHFGPNGATDHNLYVRGDRLYQSNYEFGLRILDIGDPVNPVDVAFFDTTPTDANLPSFNGSWSNYPFFESGIIVVTSGREGLFVVREGG